MVRRHVNKINFFSRHSTRLGLDSGFHFTLGYIAVIGILAGYAGPVSTVTLMAKNLRVQGLTVGTRQQQLDMIAAYGKRATGVKYLINPSLAA